MNDFALAQDMLHRFADGDVMIAVVAEQIAAKLGDDIAARGAASLVASGGTTPGALFDRLSNYEIPWEKIWITLSDERWIAPTQDGSNEKLVRTRLLRGAAASAHLIPLMTSDPSPNDAENKVSEAIGAMPRPFTVTLLGMGEDGHTASLFPNAGGLTVALDENDPAFVRAIHTQNVAATGERISLTLRAILDSKLIAILIRGKPKLAAYQRALSGSDIAEMPVRAVLNQSKTPVRVFWAP
jgi:6-phosphogluconolactonase